MPDAVAYDNDIQNTLRLSHATRQQRFFANICELMRDRVGSLTSPRSGAPREKLRNYAALSRPVIVRGR